MTDAERVPLLMELRALAGEVRGLRGELRALRADVARLRGAPRLSRMDVARLSRLLPVIGAVHGSELFTSAEVIEADAPGLRLVTAGLTPRRLGRLLRRAAGVPVAGYAVERVAVEAGACLWRALLVPEFPGEPNPRIPHPCPGTAAD